MPDIFDQISDVPTTVAPPKQDIFDIVQLEQPEPEQGSFMQRLHGAAVRGHMRLGKGVGLGFPAYITRQAKMFNSFGIAMQMRQGVISRERGLQQMKLMEDVSDSVSKRFEEWGDVHERGKRAILATHPEWKSEPPKSFVDLVTHPSKLAVGLAESTPLLVGAGILTAAGHPHVALGMMFATEGQEAYDEAIAYGASQEDADTAYTLYGLVAAALERMQLEGILKIGRKGLGPLLKRTVRKVAKRGIKDLTYDTIKIGVQEGIEEIAQGRWQEITAKMVYGKDIPGGLWDMIDRSAQEGLFGIALAGIPGVTGVAAQTFQQHVAESKDPGEQLGTTHEADKIIETSKELTPEDRLRGKTFIGDIETQIVEKVIDRFPDEITNQESLERVGNQIARHFGVEIPMEWIWSERKTKRGLGWYKRTLGGRKGQMKIFGPAHVSQRDIKRTIVHELGHEVKRPYRKEIDKAPPGLRVEQTDRGFRITYGKQSWIFFTKTKQKAIQGWIFQQNRFGRYKAHYPDFKKWVEDATKDLTRIEKEHVPIVEEIQGGEITTPSATYNAAEAQKPKGQEGITKNPWIRQTKRPSNRGRLLLMQFSSDLITSEHRQARDYYDKLYETRPGYDRPFDFWELPRWIGEVAHNMPNTDVYIIRDMDEAQRFLQLADYDHIAFSALDANKNLIRRIAENFDNQLEVGGYVDKGTFKDLPNVFWHNSIKALVEGEGREYKPGVDFRHFKDTETNPRLCMSKGCLHKCAFCTVPKGVKEVTPEMVDQQISAMKQLKTKLIYIDDKTFGQAENYVRLPELYNKIKKANPEFEGFIVQTTANQMPKFSDKFLTESGIKYMELGIESYNDSILKKVKKPATEESIDVAVNILRRHRINLIPNIIVGLPGETAETYQHTLDFLEANTDIMSHVNVYNLALYKGTQLAEVLKAESEADVNENQIAKSFYKNPQLHADFANKVYEFGSRMLDKPTVVAEPTPAVERPAERKIYRGSAYRAETGLRPTGTAADVIRYEQEELGNDLGITNEQLIELEKHPASDVVWVTRTREQAKRYGKPEEIKVQGGEILTEIPDGVLVLKPIPTKERVAEKRVKKITKKKALTLGHKYPEILGMDETQRREFMEAAVGKRSMKEMSLEEKRFVVEALEDRMRERGLIYEPEKPPTEELIETLERTKKVTAENPIASLNRRGVYRLKHIIESKLHGFVHGLERIERFIEGLDGHVEGPHYENIWRPMKDADSMSIEFTNQKIQEYISKFGEFNIDAGIWLGKIDAIPGTNIELTAAQRAGIYVLSQNKSGLRNLVEGVGLSLEQINAAKKFISPKETQMAEWLLEQYEAQWPIIQQAAAQAGIDLTTLKKEYRYAPLIRLDADLEEQHDFLSELADSFRQDVFKPEQGFLKKRKKAAGKIELDAGIMYMHNVARVERFIQMAPAATKVGKILNSRDFRRALNDRTFNQGSRLLNKWMKDSVRGTSAQQTTELGKMVSILRRNGIVYAIGYNIPSALRQTLSLSNAVAVDPLMLRYIPTNLANAVAPNTFKEMQDFVYSRSPDMASRSYDRDLRQKWNRQTLKKKLRGKSPWSKKAVSWIRWMDRHTVVVAWKSLYDVELSKTNDEKKAIAFADKWIGRTQPMANAVDLPDWFRGGTLEKLITVFQNQINNNGNFYLYDIIQAKRAQKISPQIVAYRVMFSYILPALMFGTIGRARPPKTLTELMIDLVTYPIAPIVLVGRWIDRILRGWGQSGTVAEIGAEEFVKTGRAIKEGDIPQIIKHAAATIGAFTGAPTAQMIRTAEGAIDMLAGTTRDPRRLIYSKWALEQGKRRRKKVGFKRKPYK